MNKNEIYSYLRDGLSLKDALKISFFNLNKYQTLGLDNLTIEMVSNKIASLVKKMDTDNVLEIYSTFIYRYIYKDGRIKRPINLSDEKIIYALKTMEFNEKNGFFVIKPNKGEDFEKKYSIS